VFWGKVEDNTQILQKDLRDNGNEVILQSTKLPLFSESFSQ
jgi:hypothetical protein